jgi:DNA-binding beta-propeller fold protein YncE
MLALVVAAVLAAAPPARPAAKRPAPRPTVVAMFAHDLSTPTGVVPLTWPSLTHDRATGETFVVADGFVRIFNPSGMETYRFGDDGSLGQVARVAVLEDGVIIVLSNLNGRRAYLRCDFRGELITRFGLTGLPAAFDDFAPDDLVYRNGRLYWGERASMRVVVTDPDGAYRQSFLLRELVAAGMSPDGERKPPGSMDGFGVDGSGNLLFTMSTIFAGGVVSRSGELRLFGQRGSTPGKFNNVGGIDADEKGNIYVTDRLRAVVSVWSPELKHLGDFGYRGWGPSNLITPFEIAAGNGRVYVAQAGNRGVKVFRVRILEPDPVPAPTPAAASVPPPQPARR